MVKEESFTKSNVLKDSILLLISILIVGSSVVLITTAGLGTTSTQSLPFVISQLWGFSFGTLAALFNVVFVFAQIVILGKNFPKLQFLQFVVAFALGFSVDLGVIIFDFVNPQNYLSQVSILVIGCLLMAFGIFLQLEADAIYNPVEGIVVVITDKISYEFSTVKTIFDVTLVVLSIILGLVVSGGIVGIREGTIFVALLIGPFTGLFQKIFDRK